MADNEDKRPPGSGDGETAATSSSGTGATSTAATSSAGASSSDGGTLRWLLPALTFVAGVALGAAVIAVGNSGDGPGTVAEPEESAVPQPQPSASQSDLVVRVPGICLDAIDNAEAATREVDDLVSAVRDFDAARLQQLVDRFQDLETRIRQSAEGCRAVTGDRLQDGTLVSPSLTPSA